VGHCPLAPWPRLKGHKPSGSSGDIIYVSTVKGVVLVSYPEGKIISTIPFYTSDIPITVCSDPNAGNVFLPENNTIYEYAHGATTPDATLSVPSGYEDAYGCALDPLTGDLAVAVVVVGGYGALLVYPKATGTPTVYRNKQIEFFGYLAYDASGNLFSAIEKRTFGWFIAEIPAGKTQVKFLKIVGCACQPGKLEWDGEHLVFEDSNSGQSYLGQLSVAKNSVTLVGMVEPRGIVNNDAFWINNRHVFGRFVAIRHGNNVPVGVWAYPSNGKHKKAFYDISKGEKNGIYDITISVSPSH